MSFTIPARLARATRSSVNPAEGRSRVLQLYRDWYRSAPEVVSLYALNVSPAYYRHQIRLRFERNRQITDPKAIDVLITKSRQEYQETLNLWKQPDHVMGILLEPAKDRSNRTFLEKFFEGRDENAVLPAASGVQ
ncbi:hypothetical protein C8J56DRAFT_1004194 [Mycena floridula]|nr:hypothetical protein C8J56DRAFT_1004194 [Mycena floridula]